MRVTLESGVGASRDGNQKSRRKICGFQRQTLFTAWRPGGGSDPAEKTFTPSCEWPGRSQARGWILKAAGQSHGGLRPALSTAAPSRLIIKVERTEGQVVKIMSSSIKVLVGFSHS